VTRRLAAALAVGLLLRVAAIAASDRAVGDVARYEKVARHLLDVSWNPYETQRLYPYPPPWAAVEATAGWAARQGLLHFPVAVKLPVLLADLAIVWLLGAAAAAGRASPLAPWLYAVHPVALLVGGFHGQFDAIPLAFVLLALDALARGQRDASALALAGAIATKSFPVLLLPVLATADGASARQALRYLLLASLPVALLLLPFALIDAGALRRELFAYSGIADFGWTGVWRGLVWVATGVLPRSEARFWPTAAILSKGLFLCAWAALLVASRSPRWRHEAGRTTLAIVLAFVSLYGLLSAQYLLWPVPLGLLRPGRHGVAYALAATAGLAGFYLFLAPGVLADATLGPGALAWAGRLWVLGSAATLAASLAWLAAALAARHPGHRPYSAGGG
jgi:hypothetical protein